MDDQMEFHINKDDHSYLYNVLAEMGQTEGWSITNSTTLTAEELLFVEKTLAGLPDEYYHTLFVNGSVDDISAMATESEDLALVVRFFREFFGITA